MLVFKLKLFDSWAESERLDDRKLQQAIMEMEAGLVDAQLGSGLYKKRIARKGEGRRSGYRTLVAFYEDRRAVCIFGFGKNERDNITKGQLEKLRVLAKHYLGLNKNQLAKLVKKGELIEVQNES